MSPGTRTDDFRPWPESTTTVSSPGASVPAERSIDAPAGATALVGSTNRPCLASWPCAAQSASSVTVTIAPPLARAALSTANARGGSATSIPSADEAAGATSAASSLPDALASASGAKTSTWTPNRRGIRSTSPARLKDENAWYAPSSRLPAPTGTTTTSGARRPSCSQTSNANVCTPWMKWGLQRWEA